MKPFKNREEAGLLLGAKLSKHDWKNSCILTLPRGGVPVAIEVAHQLKLPWDVLIVKKIGSPWQPEFAIGAIAEDDPPIWNENALSMMDFTEETKVALLPELREQIQHRRALWRSGRPSLDVSGKTVILIDDGLATGFSMRAAVNHLKHQNAQRIVIAVPVAPPSAIQEFTLLVDQVIALKTPSFFSAVGEWYEDFTQVSDEAVTRMIRERDLSAQLSQPIVIDLPEGVLKGLLDIPVNAKGLILFAHGSGSSHKSPRNQKMAKAFQKAGFATLLFDLLTEDEEKDRRNVFDIPLLGQRLLTATAWARGLPETNQLPMAYFGASTGAAAALVAAAQAPEIRTVVSRGGRPDLAGDFLKRVDCPVLLIVGSHDEEVVALNRAAKLSLRNASLILIPGATHLFEEPGALEEVMDKASQWYLRYFCEERTLPPPWKDLKKETSETFSRI